MVAVKICGITREADLDMAIEAGADMVGFVIVETSPRYVPFETAQALIRRAAEMGAEPWVVATLDAPGLDQLIDETSEIGAVQLHGKETPGQVASFVKRHSLVPVIKAMGIGGRRDLEDAASFAEADAFLFDAKPPKGATREGGHGRTFDWSILKGFRVNDHEDWTLSGGLTSENVAEAIRQSGAAAVDVSSGVESSPGVKDAAKVRAFIKAAKG
ncbi:MAG: phosphoribosylanthranilate isomerase [Hyphomonadaceae bacterium]